MNKRNVMAVWKFTLEKPDCTIVMPEGARILSYQLQFGIHCIWALVDPTVRKEERKFSIIGTGNVRTKEFFEDAEYIGTVQNGYLVWHLFERKSSEKEGRL